MLAALLDGRMTAEQIADPAKKKAREKIPQIVASVADHRLSDPSAVPYPSRASSS
jgi:transposase